MPKLSTKSIATPADGDYVPFLQDQGDGTFLLRRQAVVEDNLSASAAPTTGSDSDAGYAVGSRWIDTTNDRAYVCLDASVGAAVWTETTAAGGGSSGTVDINAQTGTTYTLVLADAGKLVTLTNAGAITLTVPPNASVAFSTGTTIAVTQLGAGTVTVSPGAGVTLNSLSGATDVSGQYATASLTKTGTDTWLLAGGLA